MKGTRFYKIVIAILIIINIGTLAFMWFGRPPHPPIHGERPLISNVLGLESEAKTKVDALEKAHHLEKRELLKSTREIHTQIFDQIDSENPPIDLQNKLDSNRSEISRMTYTFFNAVSKVCNEDQKKELKIFIERALIQITGGNPHKIHPKP